MRKLLIAIILSVIFTSGYAENDSENRILKGVLFTVDKKGVERYINNIEVSILGHRGEQTTKGNGNFEIQLKDYLSAGSKISFIIKKSGYSILSPYNGITFIPKDLNNEIIKLRIVPYKLEFYPTVYISNSKNGDYPEHYLQVFLTKDKSKAENYVQNLIHYGYKKSSYEKVIRNKKNVFRAIIGPYYDRNTAFNVKNKIIKEMGEFSDSFVTSKKN